MSTQPENQGVNLKQMRQEYAHYRVIRVLHDNPELTQRELAKTVGISLGKLNYCMKALVEKGWIKIHNFNHAKSKTGYVYLLTPHGVAEKARLTQRFLQRKMDEYDALKAEIVKLKNELDLISKMG